MVVSGHDLSISNDTPGRYGNIPWEYNGRNTWGRNYNQYPLAIKHVSLEKKTQISSMFDGVPTYRPIDAHLQCMSQPCLI